MKVNRRRGTVLSTLLVGCALIAPGVASAESTGVLTPELAQLATPAVQEQSPAEQAETLGVPAEGTGSLEREGEDIVVEISFSEGALAALPALSEAGAEVVVSSDVYQRVTAKVDPADLHSVAQVPGVISVEAVQQPIFNAVEQPHTSVEAKAVCEGGKVLTEGLDQLEIVTQPNNRIGAREAYGVRGAGETIGVLSDSYDTGATIVVENPKTKKFEAVPSPTHAAEDIQSNDLPGLESTCSGQQVPVNVLEDGLAPPEGDEGRAMLQVVHDVAPHAKLAFATAAGGELNFAHNIERLAAPVVAGGAGATVIVDDTTYPEEPMFQDGPIAVAINKVTAAGVTYVTAAGNDNVTTYNRDAKGNITSIKTPEAGAWEAPKYVDTAEPAFCPIPVGVAERHCLNFAPEGKPENAKFEIVIPKGRPIEIAVGWSEPVYGVKADLDAYILHYREKEKVVYPGETEVGAEDKDANVNLSPGAHVEWVNPAPKEEIEGEFELNKVKYERVFLVVNRCFGSVCDQEANPAAKPRVKVVFLGRVYPNPILEMQYENSEGVNKVGPAIFGHAGDPLASTIGASSFRLGEKINAAGYPDTYSSRGPVTHYWAPATSTTPAAEIPGGEVIAKPNVVATDCNATTFFTRFTFSAWRFCGTSAAASHAAGIVALMHQIDPAQTPFRLRQALAETAEEVPGYGPNAVGEGLIRARLAVQAMGVTSPVNDPPSTYVAPIKPTPPPPEEEEKPAPAPTPTPTPAPSPAPSPPVSNATGGEARSSSNEKEGGKTIHALPTTTIAKHPPKLVKSPVGRPKLKFTFTSDQKGVKFECSVDGAKWKVCAAKYSAPFTLGAHELKVRARSTDGSVDKSPAVFKFNVKLVA